MPSPDLQPNSLQQSLETNTLIYNQQSFAGGMNQQTDPTDLQPNEYPLLINGRTRFGDVEPVQVLVDADTQGTLAGLNVQGIYSAGPFFIVFAGGKAFYRDVSSNSSAFIQIAGFAMSSSVDTIFAEAVPISSLNYIRRLADADSNTSGIELFSATAASPQCLVCQDGVNQPRLIFPDGSSRQAGTYTDWTTSNREYVPIGKQMMYLNGVLYIAALTMTGSLANPSAQIYRSVTGRPLDFVINIDINGDKGGDAETTSFAVDYDEITCLQKVNSNEGGFYVGTAKNSYLVIPVTTGSLPFNEPLYRIQPLFNTGPLNNFSVCDIMGDTALIDFGGIRSFNATLQTRNEGRNLPFSKKISLLFTTLVQEVTAAISYDDYAFFAVETIYGRAIVVYDTITQTWVGLDIYEELVGVAIEQFCEVKIGVTRKLYIRTSDNHVYELFVGTEAATTQMFIGEWCSNDPLIEQLLQSVKCVFNDVEQAGNVTITPYVDRRAFTSVVKAVPATTSVWTLPLAIPFGPSTSDVVRNVNFDIEGVANGWKVGVLISWSMFAGLSHVRALNNKVKAEETTDEEAASVYA